MACRVSTKQIKGIKGKELKNDLARCGHAEETLEDIEPLAVPTYLNFQTNFIFLLVEPVPTAGIGLHYHS